MGEVALDTDIMIKSIGYASTPMAGVPFNQRSKTIPHDFGCVLDEENKPM